MRLAVMTKRARRMLSAGSSAITPWAVGRVVALIALLGIGTGLYLNMAPEGEIAVSPPMAATEGRSQAPSGVAPDQVEVLDRSAIARGDSTVHMSDIDYLPEDDPYSSMTLKEATQAAAPGQGASHRQIERLEGEISALLAVTSQDPSTNPSQLDRKLRQLDDLIDMLRLEEMEQQ